MKMAAWSIKTGAKHQGSLHELKIWPEFFQAVLTGKKTHEIRVNDRNFKAGDVLWLRYFDPNKDAYSGDSLFCDLTYVSLGGEWGIPDDIAVLSIRHNPDLALSYLAKN